MNPIHRIGVFDSGLGGLTVLAEICRKVKDTELIYFGDTARVPYGSRGTETIFQYARQDANFLLSQNVEAIVVACGTVSSTCLDRLRESYPVPVIGVIEPAAKEAAGATKTRHIGVVGTSATIRSGAFEKKIRELDPEIRVTSTACPIWVPLIENGFSADDPIAELAVQRYLEPFSRTDIDTLILGCTHYPFFTEAIRKALPGIRQIHIGRALADELADTIPVTRTGKENSIRYYFSDTETDFGMLTGNSSIVMPIEKAEKISIEMY